MLRKGLKPDNDKGAVYDKIAEQKKATPISHPETSTEKTVIGEKISIEGELRGDEDLVIEGSMKGKIEMEKHSFTIGPLGRVEGEIKAQNVKISGQMIGNINTQGKVEITKEADFEGDIRARSISVEDGAYFKGSIELDKEPHRKSASAAKLTNFTTPQPVKEPKIQTVKEKIKEN